jgi:hypothetical protein
MTQYSMVCEYQHLQCSWGMQLSCQLSDDRKLEYYNLNLKYHVKCQTLGHSVCWQCITHAVLALEIIT